eukprot:jgi/Bigna1/130068/aug1.10_g4776
MLIPRRRKCIVRHPVLFNRAIQLTSFRNTQTQFYAGITILLSLIVFSRFSPPSQNSKRKLDKLPEGFDLKVYEKWRDSFGVGIGCKDEDTDGNNDDDGDDDDDERSIVDN